MDTPTPENQQDWLRELATKSWEPELIISAAAIYLTGSLPEWIDAGFFYFDFNLADGDLTSANQLALMGILFFKLTAYFLTAGFVAHFVLRAFWVSALGLQSVLPNEINYDKVGTLSQFGRQMARQKLGSFADFIVRLDKTCSTLLSVVFYFAIVGVNVALLYLTIFGFTYLIKGFFPTHFQTITWVVRLVVLGFSIVLIGAALLAKTKWIDRHPALARGLWRLQWGLPRILFPLGFNGFYRLGLMFQSNLSKRTYALAVVGFALSLMVGLAVMLVNQRGMPLKTRDFYTRYSDNYHLATTQYDNLRPKGRAIYYASIPSEAVTGPHLKLFIAYPKILDSELAKFCRQPPLPTSLPEPARIEQRTAAYVACFDRYFQVSLNDSLCQNLDYLFARHPNQGEVGLFTYLSTRACRPGKNLLKITRPHPDSLARRETYTVIPFWYLP
ncbi:MAG: hypothetical protein MUC97_10910 [Bernardetiaceae bacterium]|nr:hypothetical protein [Bernardetiaceae bacterium]